MTRITVRGYLSPVTYLTVDLDEDPLTRWDAAGILRERFNFYFEIEEMWRP